ncbi:polysaccharide biosynthesis tyrosine autokinase [Soonwooa sp.]|uniref:GumC family protein n=1 Tax=Soonwooa sp. TaxID=1938592 RepID=UPI0028AF5D95|nr:polysaccharide biosynthesis tyrosine autokinase [Soonwooa sp.]
MELLDNQTASRKHKINLKKELKKYVKFWPLFLIFPLLFYTAAKIYLRYTPPQYFSKTTLKFEQTSPRAAQQALNDLKNLGVGVSNEELDAETVVMVSKPILGQVVKNLNLDVKYYSVGAIKEVEYYNELPIKARIVELKNPEQFGGVSYLIESKNTSSFTLSDVEGKNLKKYNFGQVVDLGFGKVVFERKFPSIEVKNTKVVFTNPKNVISGLEGALNVSIYKSLLMDISMTSASYRKSEAILKELVNVYNAEGIKDKNQEAQFTADFIDKRLQIITDELEGIENQKEGVKKDYQITDLAAQAQMALSNVNANTKELLGIATQYDLVNSVYQLSNNSSQNLLPTGLGLSSSIDSQISKYNELVLTRNRVLKQATNQNPAVVEMNKQIGILKEGIRANLGDVRRSLQDNMSRLQSDINADQSKINKFPKQERIFRSIDRQQNLKEALFLFLLQKREENSINLAVALPKAKVVNPPYTTGIVAPKGQMILYSAIALGVILPLLFIFIKLLLNTKIYSKEDMDSVLSNASLIGEIPENNDKEELMKLDDFTVYAESFRILASNLKHMLKVKGANQKSATILVTSSVKGEGKTTISMNLAVSLSGNAKVLIIGADIRNPQLQRFVHKSKIGLTDYLVSDDITPEAYIIDSRINANLDIFFSGAKSPNPNDLLDMDKFDDMITYLRTKYDYIVMDSAPMMLVSDTLNLVDQSDYILYVAKANYTEKEMLLFAENFMMENNVNNMSFVLNNVKPQFSRYANKYGYGYGYYNETRSQSFITKLLNR